MKAQLATRLLVGFAAALLGLGLNAYIAHNAVRNLIGTEAWVTHTYEVLREIETDVSLAKDVETGTRGYVITNDRVFLEPYQKARLKVQNKLEPLYSMVRDNPPQQKRVLELAKLVDKKLEESKTIVQMVDAGRTAEVKARIKQGGGKAMMDDIRAKANEMRNEEERLLAIRTREAKLAGRNANATILLAMGFSLLLLTLVYVGLTRAKAQGEQLEIALEKQQHLEEMRDSLNAMLVHDLRTPLTTMLVPLEMLNNEDLGELEETQKEIVGMSLVSSRRLLGLVNELLDVSKMEAGELKVRHESLDPHVVIDDSIKNIALAEYDGAAHIENTAAKELPLLQADQELLTRVLINLLGNAVKFTPRGGTITLGANPCQPLEIMPPRVKATLSKKQLESLRAPALAFTVNDTGEGVPGADLDRIFDKFGQVESRKEGRKMSSGLGLTFCKLAIEAHGGAIWVESQPGQGSTFSFTVPLRSQVDEAELERSTAQAAVGT